MQTKWRAYDIDWETDGYSPDLPNEVLFDLEDEGVEDGTEEEACEIIGELLSDNTGWLHNGFKLEPVKEQEESEELPEVTSDKAIAQRLYDCLNYLRHLDQAQGIFNDDSKFQDEVDDGLQMFEEAKAKEIEVDS